MLAALSLLGCDGCGCVFFFSGRRRHTRYVGDWSSDVCSSDLCSRTSPTCTSGKCVNTAWQQPSKRACLTCHDSQDASARSEERRVGKEWILRGSPEQSDRKE